MEILSGHRIGSVDQWAQLAGPKGGDEYWKDCRSAKELAKAFLRSGKPELPVELRDICHSLCDGKNFVPVKAIAEKVTRLDSFRGEHRNHDLVLEGLCGNDRIVVCIEAKTDETFGATIKKRHDDSLARSEHSMVGERIQLLATQLFGNERADIKKIGSLQYQLLTGIGGTLIEAENQGARKALFLVYEFRCANLNEEKIVRNQTDLNNFVDYLTEGRVRTIEPGIITEKIFVPGGSSINPDIQLFIGKVVHHLG